jgi:hypothetical protein
VRPLNKYGFTVPIIGEIVLICTGPGEATDTLVYDTQYYYVDTVNVFNNQNINPTPGTWWFKAANDNRTEQFDWNVPVRVKVLTIMGGRRPCIVLTTI